MANTVSSLSLHCLFTALSFTFSFILVLLPYRISHLLSKKLKLHNDRKVSHTTVSQQLLFGRRQKGFLHEDAFEVFDESYVI